MRIIVLGGAGDMGSRAVEDLAATPGVAEVTIADRDVAAAEKLCQRLEGGAARVNVRAVDASNAESLAEAMRGYDAAASALGPFYRFEPLMAAAAIAARTHYVSICDDWSAWLEVHERFHGAARDAGVIVLSGMGASPGLTNLMALRLAREMERVARIDVSCYQPWSAGGGEAVLRHLLFIVTGEIGAWREGRETRVTACTERHAVELPKYGNRTLYNLGHPEPVTLPRHFPGLETCHFWMGFGTGMGLLARLGRGGWFQGERRVDRVIRLAGRFERWLSPAEPGLSSLRVDVWGEREGAPAHAMACGLGTMRDGTALPLAAGACMLARNELTVTEGGVYAPEACVDPDRFVQDMAAKGIHGYRDLAMTEALS